MNDEIQKIISDLNDYDDVADLIKQGINLRAGLLITLHASGLKQGELIQLSEDNYNNEVKFIEKLVD
jgi:hypothetical protein